MFKKNTLIVYLMKTAFFFKEHGSFDNERRGNLSPAAVGENSEDIPGLGQYDDFQTIDWQRDLARDRMHHRYITKRKEDSVLSACKAAHDAWSGWVCVLLGDDFLRCLVFANTDI